MARKSIEEQTADEEYERVRRRQRGGDAINTAIQGVISPSRSKRAGLSQAETKREIAKQKAENARLQRKAGRPVAVNRQRGK